MATTTSPLPLASGTWTLDPTHSTVEFTARHMAISKVRGRFQTFDATVEIGNTLENSHVKAVVELSSVDTNNVDRDNHLRGSDFFNVDKHPQMIFSSTDLTDLGDGSYKMIGNVTIGSVTKQETFILAFRGTETFPADGSLRAGFEATGTINRTTYGIDFNVPLGAGGFVISDKIGIELDIQLVSPQG